MMKHIYRLYKIWQRQLPWERPEEVEHTFVEPKGEKKFEKRRNINLIKEDGKFMDFKLKSKREMWTESKAPRISVKIAAKYSLLLKDK